MSDLGSGLRVLAVPEVPPEEWFREDPGWFTPGATIHVKIDGEDEGRVAGLVQAAAGSARFMADRSHPNYGRKVVDARTFPDGFRTFNRGPLDVVAANGERRQVQVGKIAIWGNHSERDISASSLAEAVPYLHREGKWERFDDIGLIGTASAVESGEFAGAVMFRGMAVPGMTVRGAFEVNSTTMSPELWDDPQYGGLVFAGPVRVDHTAWPYDVPERLAASTGSDGLDRFRLVSTVNGPVVVRCGPYTGVDGSGQGDSGRSATMNDSVAAAHEPGHEDGELGAAVSGRLDDLTAKVAEVETELAELAIQLLAGDDFNRDSEIKGLRLLAVEQGERLEKLEALLSSAVDSPVGTEPSTPLDQTWKQTTLIG